jgi:type IV secretory pathway TraG/TraD family ATPase VirD4
MMRGDTNQDIDGELFIVALLGMALVVLLIAGAIATVAATVATWMLGGPWVLPSPSSWLAGLFRLLLGSSAGLASAPWAVVSDHPLVYGLMVALLGLASFLALGVTGWWVWQWVGPTRAGHATREEIRAELSVEAARDRAQFTRPTMTIAQRRVAELTEVGAPMHYGPIGPLCVPFENNTGTLAPTQTGKSRRDLSHKALGAPGPLLCSSTKPDLCEFAALTCARRGHPVLVFDTTGTVRWPALLRWSPIQGCDTQAAANRRAKTLVEASAVSLRGIAGNDKVFRDRAKTVLAAYLLAAALSERGVGALLSWSTSRSSEPATVLEEYPEHQPMAANLRGELAMVAETSDAVWMSVRRVLEPLLDPQLRALCSPPPGSGFDARSFIAARGALFLIAGDTQAGSAAPFLTALADYWLETAREMALHQPGRRLDPPATAVLDELGNATALPDLPTQVADTAGRGVIVHWAAQSRAGLEMTYGPEGAALLIENTTLISQWGGSKDQRTLEWISILTGHRERRRYQTQSDGFLSGGRSSMGTETVPVYRPGDVRRLPRGQVLIVHRALGPIRAKTRDISQRPDWKQLSADQEAVRNGDVPVDSHGRLTDNIEPITSPIPVLRRSPH